MSYHYLLESGEACSHQDSWGSRPDALARLMPSAGTYCCNDSGMEHSQSSPSGTTFGRLMETLGARQLTLLPEDSRAKTSARQVPNEDSPGPVQDYSLKCSESSAKFNLDMSLPKTHRAYVPMDSAQSSKGLPAWGMTHDGVCWEVATSVRPTKEIECGCLLPTPTTVGNEFSPSMRKWPCHAYFQEVYGDLPKIALREWMMGWPIGWTESAPLEMGKYRSWLQQHGES